MCWFNRIRRRVVLAYQLICAREDARNRGLSLPQGIWRCEHCGLITWDQQTFAAHSRTHST
jgi:ribosomal protein L37AE/L43A